MQLPEAAMTFDDVQRMKLGRLFDAGVPFDAIAFYGRWWQFERWLRDMVYLELRAKGLFKNKIVV